MCSVSDSKSSDLTKAQTCFRPRYFRYPSRILLVTRSRSFDTYNLVKPCNLVAENIGSRVSRDAQQRTFVARAVMAKLNKNPQGQAATGSPWIYGPALDLVVGCGAWSAPLLLVSYFSIASSTRIWSI